MPSPTRQDTYLILAQVDDPATGQTVNLGKWDTFSGGAVDSEESIYHPGGMDAPISLGGRKEYEAVTITRYFDLIRDAPLFKWLTALAGETRGGISWTPLTLRGAVAGDPVFYGGTLKKVGHDEITSEGGEAAMVELELTVDTIV